MCFGRCQPAGRKSLRLCCLPGKKQNKTINPILCVVCMEHCKNIDLSPNITLISPNISQEFTKYKRALKDTCPSHPVYGAS